MNNINKVSNEAFKIFTSIHTTKILFFFHKGFNFNFVMRCASQLLNRFKLNQTK